MFNKCSDLNNLDVSNFNTENVTAMCGMFNKCSNLTNIDVSKFDTENITDMSFMFNECYNLINLDISNFNTNKVENINGMFQNCSKLFNLNKNEIFKNNSIFYSNFDLLKFNITKNIKDIEKMQYINSINLGQSKFNSKNIIISNKNKKYTLFNIIGKGGFGICYMAKDENNEIYAIKKININNENYKNVINEINILKIMKSTYSVDFIESIEKDDNIYIVMELCDGNLNDLLEKKNEKLDIVTIIKITNQLNEVLKLMHSKKIVHRDLKPENILIKYNYDYLFNYIIVGDMSKILIK
jgi:surface protein